MKRIVLILFISSMLVVCSACEAIKAQSTKPIITPSESQTQESDPLAVNLSEIPLYEVLGLSEAEQVLILDVSEDRLLINVYTDYTQDNPQFKEEGYNSVTKELKIYDTSEDRIVMSLKMPDGVFCTDASFLGDAFAYVTVSPTKDAPAKYNIEVYDGTTTSIITSGECLETGYDEPQVEALGDTQFAYSFYDYETNMFGVNVSSTQGEITPQISLVDDGSTEHLRTTLCGNGAEYIYYAAVKSKGTIFVGNADNLTHQFVLPQTERIYEFCFLENRILFTMEKSDANSTKKEIVIKDYEGNNLLARECEALYRLKSNGKDTVLGIDGKYTAYLVHVSDDEISSQIIDVESAPVQFNCLNDNTFLLHYYRGNNEGHLRLLRLTI